MFDLYFRADNEAALKAALPEFIGGDEWRHASQDWAFDPVGLIVDQPAVFEDGELVSAETYHPGWHANARVMTEAAALAFEANPACLGCRIVATGAALFGAPPATPSRVWA